MLSVNQPIQQPPAYEKINEITRVLTTAAIPPDSFSLFGGKAGLSLYFSYLSRYEQTSHYDELIAVLISDSFDTLKQHIRHPTFSFGISGVLWTIHHLKSHDFIDVEDYFSELTPFLGEQMIAFAADNNFDYLHGAMGIGFYLMHFENKHIQNYLSKLILLLKQKSISENGLLKWKNNFNYHQKMVCNLSLSHGMAGMVIFLSHLIQKCPALKEEAVELVEKSLSYLLLQKKNRIEEHHLSLFPDFGDGADPSENSRLSWCYGDLGIASACWQAGTVMNNKHWKEEAIRCMIHTAGRRNLVENQVADAGFCHGTAGIAHLFNRFYWETKDLIFKDASSYWIKETLKMATFKDGLAGFKSLQGVTPAWTNDYGLLEGIAGIGLVLLNSVYQEEPTWDQCFLLS